MTESISRDRISWCSCWDPPYPHIKVDGECIRKITERERRRTLREILPYFQEDAEEGA